MEKVQNFLNMLFVMYSNQWTWN